MTYKVGILGATGAVGQKSFTFAWACVPIFELRLLASARSAGKVQSYKEHSWTIEETTEASFQDLDICIFSAGGAQSKHFAPIAKQAGC